MIKPYLKSSVPSQLHAVLHVRLWLGIPVVPFFPFPLGVSWLRLSIMKKGTAIIMGLLGNLDGHQPPDVSRAWTI